MNVDNGAEYVFPTQAKRTHLSYPLRPNYQNMHTQIVCRNWKTKSGVLFLIGLGYDFLGFLVEHCDHASRGTVA